MTDPNPGPTLADLVVKPCEDCGDPEAEHVPCPYAQDIRGDDTLHWLCSYCQNERAMDI